MRRRMISLRLNQLASQQAKANSAMGLNVTGLQAPRARWPILNPDRSGEPTHTSACSKPWTKPSQLSSKHWIAMTPGKRTRPPLA